MGIQPATAGTPRDETSFIEEARRRQIIEAAIDVIAEVGYRRASFGRIAERARISPSLISYHFQAKTRLNRAIAETIAHDLDAAVSGAAAEATSYLDAVRRVIVGFVAYVDANQSRMLALRQMEAALAPEERADIGVLNEGTGIARWVDLLSAGQAAGEFRAFDARTVAVGIMGLLNAVPHELIGNPGADGQRLGDELSNLVTAGISSVAGIASEATVAKRRTR